MRQSNAYATKLSSGWILMLSLLAIPVFVESVDAKNKKHEPIAAASLSNQQLDDVEELIGSAVSDVLPLFDLMPGQQIPPSVSVHFDTATSTVTVELGVSYLPATRNHISELDHQSQEIINAVVTAVGDNVILNGIKLTFGGQEATHYYPAQPTAVQKDKAKKASGTVSLVVSAGHGLYNHGTLGWTTQRDPFFGMVEDFITPIFAEEVKLLVVDRILEIDTISMPRRRILTSPEIHPETLQPWWKVAARYNLEVAYPTIPEIWNANVGPGPDREARQDHYSRPRFANHIGAISLLHLHTNGTEFTVASGTRVYTPSIGTQVATSQRLGRLILCHMKEIINAQELYEDWIVATSPVVNNGYAENRDTLMPTALVEIGFHNNPNDARALQQSDFQSAAMKGVVKGQELHMNGETECTPFEITDVPDIVIPFNTTRSVRVYYEGHPEFSVNVQAAAVQCGPNWTCPPYGVYTREETNSPLKWYIRCEGFQAFPVTHRYSSTLTDIDGVKTSSVESNITCSPSATGASEDSGGQPVMELMHSSA